MIAGSFARSVAEHWWLFLIRGILALIFAVLILIYPSAAVFLFTVIFAGYAFADGIMALIQAFRSSQDRLWLILRGILGVGIGVFVLLEPGLGLGAIAWALAVTIGVWAFVGGILEIVLAVRLRKEIDNEWVLILIGVLQTALGVFLLLEPVIALLTWVYVLALYALFAGVAFIVLAFRLKGFKDKVTAATA